MILVKDLTKDFGAFRAVDSISFSANFGEMLGFLGPNGAGKTTTMRLLSGFLQPTSGEISILGMSPVDRSEGIKRQLGYLPEGAPLYGEMRVCDFLKFLAQIRGISNISQAIEKVVNDVSLGSVMYKTIDHLSKGFKRRVGLAQALIHNPQVLLLDEPTDGLDPNQKHEVRELLKKLRKEKIVIISTHLLEEVSSLCSRVIIINKGCLLLNESPDELLSRSKYCNAVSIVLNENISSKIKLQASQNSIQYNEVIKKLLSQDNLSSIDIECSENLEGVISMSFISREGHDILEKVQSFLSKNNISYNSINVEKGRLDEVFRTITKP